MCPHTTIYAPTIYVSSYYYISRASRARLIPGGRGVPIAERNDMGQSFAHPRKRRLFLCLSLSFIWKVSAEPLSLSCKRAHTSRSGHLERSGDRSYSSSGQRCGNASAGACVGAQARGQCARDRALSRHAHSSCRSQTASVRACVSYSL
jgi:hypothetical protein